MFNNFNEDEINNFYKEVYKNNDYLSKYDLLSNDNIDFLNKTIPPTIDFNYTWDNRDFSRIRTVLDFNEWVIKYNIVSENLAYTYENDPEMNILKYNNKTLIEYDYITFNGDLHNLNDINKYDFFLFNQTLEHLYNPFLSVKNIYNSLSDGGYVFTSVPTVTIPHSTPIHFNSFTPMGIYMLFKSCGFQVLEIGQWGNYEYISKLFNNHNWPGYKHLSQEGIKNEDRNCVGCWILAKKINK
jgi:hypothetical protein